ncbi:MAG: thioesterase family protein [Flavobacteriaceae bacterium]
MEQKKPIVSLEVRVHWGDMDAMQHVNNIIYLKWVESTRLLLFEQLMKGETAGLAEIGPILAWSDIKYIAPVVYPDTVKIDFDIVRLKEDRLECQAHLYSTAQNRLVAISKNTIKAYNIKKLKKAEIPSHWIRQLRRHYGESI